jgi:cell division protein FtsN
VVQVGAFRSDAEAQTYWSRMQANLGEFLNGKSSDIERIDKGAEGVYHRLRVGPFSSSDAARQYCVGLKERGQDCFAASL